VGARPHPRCAGGRRGGAGRAAAQPGRSGHRGPGDGGDRPRGGPDPPSIDHRGPGLLRDPRLLRHPPPGADRSALPAPAHRHRADPPGRERHPHGGRRRAAHDVPLGGAARAAGGGGAGPVRADALLAQVPPLAAGADRGGAALLVLPRSADGRRLREGNPAVRHRPPRGRLVPRRPDPAAGRALPADGGALRRRLPAAGRIARGGLCRLCAGGVPGHCGRHQPGRPGDDLPGVPARDGGHPGRVRRAGRFV